MNSGVRHENCILIGSSTPILRSTKSEYPNFKICSRVDDFTQIYIVRLFDKYQLLL